MGMNKFMQPLVILWFTIKALWIGLPALGLFLFLNEVFISGTGNYKSFIDLALGVSRWFAYPFGYPFGIAIWESVYIFDVVQEHMQSVSHYYFQDSSIVNNIVQWIVMFLGGYIQWFILVPYFMHKICRMLVELCLYVKRFQFLRVAHHTLQRLYAKQKHSRADRGP